MKYDQKMEGKWPETNLWYSIYDNKLTIALQRADIHIQLKTQVKRGVVIQVVSYTV